MPRELKMIAVADLDDQQYRMRTELVGPENDLLIGSVKAVGVLVPILVKPHGDKYAVVAGHRRTHAARVAGLFDVPCYVLIDEPAGGWTGAFAENLFRADLTPVEESAAICDCIELGKQTVEEVAIMMQRTPEWVKERVTMLTWPGDVLEAVHAGGISVAAARNLIKITDDNHRSLLLDYGVESGVTARITAAWFQSWEAGKALEDPGSVEPVPGRVAGPPTVPYTPCVICGRQFKMAELRYNPMCGDCGETLVQHARAARQSEPGVDGGVHRV